MGRKVEKTEEPVFDSNRWKKREVKVSVCCQSSNDGKRCNEDLRLMMLGCEDLPPYGPLENTALMFVNLLATAIREKNKPIAGYTGRGMSSTVTLSVAIYNAKQKEYPTIQQEWNWYHGAFQYRYTLLRDSFQK
jgi:hypothetical protein